METGSKDIALFQVHPDIQDNSNEHTVQMEMQIKFLEAHKLQLEESTKNRSQRRVARHKKNIEEKLNDTNHLLMLLTDKLAVEGNDVQEAIRWSVHMTKKLGVFEDAVERAECWLRDHQLEHLSIGGEKSEERMLCGSQKTTSGAGDKQLRFLWRKMEEMEKGFLEREQTWNLRLNQVEESCSNNVNSCKKLSGELKDQDHRHKDEESGRAVDNTIQLKVIQVRVQNCENMISQHEREINFLKNQVKDHKFRQMRSQQKVVQKIEEPNNVKFDNIFLNSKHAIANTSKNQHEKKNHCSKDSRNSNIHKSLIKELEQLPEIHNISDRERIHSFYNRLARIVDTLTLIDRVESSEGYIYTVFHKLGPVREVLVQCVEGWEDWTMKELVENLRCYVRRHGKGCCSDGDSGLGL